MNKRVILLSVTVILVLLITLSAFPEQVYDIVLSAFNQITYNLGIFYLLSGVISLIFVVIVTWKHGTVVLGDRGEKKEYSDFSWAAMMFCTGIGGSMMVFSFIEPLYYLNDPPFGIVPMSAEAYEYAHMYGQFHWGFLDWMLCVPLTLFIAYYVYVKKADSYTLGGMLNDFKKEKSIFADLVDAFCIIAIIGGAATSMGLSAPIICRIISKLLGIADDEKILIAVFVIWFVIFTTSVWKGLEKGIKKLSYMNICIAMLFISFLVILVNPIKVINTESNSVGLLLQNFLRMTFYTDPFEQSGFPQRWTVFYWALTLAYAPGVAIFTARISKGRTIKQLVWGMIVYGSLGTMFSFATLGLYSLVLQKEGILDLVNILSTQGKEAVIIAILGTLPVHQLFEIVYAVVCMIFMATTIDSSVYVIASITSKKAVAKEDDPPRNHRIAGAVFMLIFSVILTRIGGLETMQTASIIMAFPVIIINVIVIVKMLKVRVSGRDGKDDTACPERNMRKRE